MAKKSSGWIPNQHGAWAMLVVPSITGVLLSSGAWRQLPLIAFWLVGYFAFFAGASWLKVRRGVRYRQPTYVYGAVSAMLGLLVLFVTPHVWPWVAVFVPLMGVSLVMSARKHERALLNDAVTIAAACLFGLVVFHAAWPDLRLADAPRAGTMVGWTGVLFAYFFGTALYVKTLIRERTSVAYRRLSIGYHCAYVVCLAAAAVYGWWGTPSAWPWLLALVGAGLLARAAALAGRRVKPMHVGLGEIGVCALLVALVASWH